MSKRHVNLMMDESLYDKVLSFGQGREQTVSQVIRCILREKFTDPKEKKK